VLLVRYVVMTAALTSLDLAARTSSFILVMVSEATKSGSTLKFV